jgi:pyridinium-3,5-bisthiocarboxylic acid mononucleotide nickel chelatase
MASALARLLLESLAPRAEPVALVRRDHDRNFMILYLDCIGGIAGDMLMAALIDAGAAVEAINAELQKLGIPNLVVSAKRTTKHAIDCCHVSVTWGAGQTEPLELNDVAAAHQHQGDLTVDHSHPLVDDHPGDEVGTSVHSPHAHRPYAAIRDLLNNAGFTPAVTARAQAVFRKLAEAEGSIHGVPAEDVHFHEVGSEDAIADVVGVVLALEQLAVAEIVVSPLPIGRGFVRSAHGILPLPAPATMELLRGIPIEGVDIDRELVTPTGAAIVAALGTEFGRFPSMTTMAVGYGAGTRDLAERPNVVRAVLGTRTETKPPAAVIVIETNLDDCSPELIPDAALAAATAGALDVWITPATMKKGRPGFVLHALARPDRQDAVAAAILRETSALGVRISHHERVELERSFFSVDVDGQSINIKVGSQNGAVINVAPEHDDCAAAAGKLSLPVKEVFARALTSASAHLRNSDPAT